MEIEDKGALDETKQTTKCSQVLLSHKEVDDSQ